MTDDIERLKALEVAATKGPWYHCRPFETIPPVRTVHGPVPGQRIDYVSTWPGMGTPKDHKVVIPMEGREQTVSSEDMALIVAIRNTLPALLDRLEKAEGELAEAREDVRSLCRFILNEWGPDGALKATTFALEQRQSAKGGDANAAPDRDTNSKSATSPGVTAGASALASARAEGRKEGLAEAAKECARLSAKMTRTRLIPRDRVSLFGLLPTP